MVVTYEARKGSKHRPTLDFAHLRCGEMQKRGPVERREVGKDRGEYIRHTKIRGANGFYRLSRPIPQICVVLITIRLHRRLLVKLWSLIFDYLSGTFKAWEGRSLVAFDTSLAGRHN